MANTILRISAIAMFALVACATPPDSNLPSVETAPELRVVVTPLNLAVRTPPELEGKGDRVWFEVLRYLQERNGTIATLSPSSADRIWLIATERLEAPDRKSALRLAQSRLAQALAGYRSYDLLVVPSLVLRPGRMHGHTASWDGVHRVVPNAEALVATGIGDVVHPHGSVWVAGLSGKIGAVSLHVSVLYPDGTLAYEGLGGIDLVQKAQRSSVWSNHWAFETRSDPLGNTEHIREGVERAFNRQLLAIARER
jgi:hypothetical protein